MPPTNRELAEQIKRDLVELIVRGNIELLPLANAIQGFLDQITMLERQIAELNALDPDDD